MPRSRSAIALGATACLLALGSGARSAHADVLADRWASPAGTSLAACTQDDPCDIVTAINAAPATSVVHVESGSYGSPDSPLTTQLEADNPITIEAATPADPPVITSDAAGGSSLVTYHSDVSDLVIRSSSPTTGLYLLDNSSASRVAVFGTGGTFGACSVEDSTLTDSVCSQTADHAAAIGLHIAGTGTTTDTFINVTAVATGEHGIGVDSAASEQAEFDATFTNAIIQGTQHDVRVTASDAATSTVTTDHSLYRPARVASGGATVSGDATDVQGKAKFANLADGDFHERRTSPSVDAGGSPTSGGNDLAGNPRVLGKAPDIGAYEYLARPQVGRLKLARLDHRLATFTVTVNPEGLQTDVVLVARHKLHTVTSRVLDAGNGNTSKRLRLSFLLDPDTKYHVRARATNQGGVMQSPNTHFTT